MTSSAGSERLCRQRLTAQALAGPRAAGPLTVTRRLLALQAQDARAARLAIRARTAGRSTADVDRALTEDHSLVITWLNRGTLHLVAAEDYAWLHALTTPPLRTACTRRLAQEGVNPAMTERALGVVTRSLADDGPLTSPELRERLDRAGIRTAGQALVHVLFAAALEGLIIRGPMHGRRHAYVLTRDWLGDPGRPVQRDVALGELARRYLIGHTPATERDLARWAGLSLRDARAGLARIASELRDDGGGQLRLHTRERVAPLPAPRLLGGWEPALVGWTSRTWLLGEHDATVVSGGLFRNFALVGGRAVATWRFDGPDVVIEPFVELDAAETAALRDDATALRAYLGGGPRAQ